MRPLEVRLEKSSLYEVTINYPCSNNDVDYIFKNGVSSQIVGEFLVEYEEEIKDWQEEHGATETYFILEFDRTITPESRGLEIGNILADKLHHDFYISKTSRDFFDPVYSIETIENWIYEMGDDSNIFCDIGNFKRLDIHRFNNEFSIRILDEDTEDILYSSSYLEINQLNVRKSIVETLRHVY